MPDPGVPDDVAAKIAAIKAKMGGAKPAAPAPAAPAQPAAPAAPAAPASGTPAPAAAAAGGGSDMASKIAAMKARMAGGGAAAAAPAAAAPGAAPSPPADVTAGSALSSPAEVAARVAALKAKMASGLGAPPAAAAGATAAAPTLAAAGATTAAPKVAPKPAAKAGAKPIWPVQPIDRTSFGEDFLYGPGTLTRWFAVGGLLLVGTVLWMLKHDYDRDWKGFQKEFREIKLGQAKEALAAADAGLDQQKLTALETQLEQAQAQVDANAGRLAELQAQRSDLEGQYYRLDQVAKFAKSEFDAARYAFEELRLSHGGDEERMAKSEANLQGLLADMNTKQAAADASNLELEGVKAEIAGLLAARTAVEKQREELTASRDLIARRVKAIDHNLFNDYIRNAPIADMLAPTLKIDQQVLPDLKDNYNFMYVGRVDRCTTCHVGIDDPKFTGDAWDQPGQRVFMAHPRLDLFVADNSPHPKAKFGCTVCHQGRGQAVEFPRTFHVPTADAKESAADKQARWTRDYGFDEHRHYWDWPMVPTDKLYSSCFQCHQETDRIQGVPQYNDSRALVETLGCYGCHKIAGFEHLRKVGPDLSNIAAKTTETWARKWVMEPRAFRPTTRMPQFFDQSNTGGEMGGEREWNNASDRYVADWRARNQVEARAIVAYVFEQSRERLVAQPFTPAQAPGDDSGGDAAAGKELFTKRGCLGCHSMERDDLVAEHHGPDLSKLGSKTTAAWLFDWIREPRHYFPTTVMPDLRLSDEEVRDVAAYLMQGRDEAWEQRPEPAADPAILESIAVEYLAPLSSEAHAKQQVDEMRGKGGDAEVEQFVGLKLFSRYGCAGCHLVPGHEEDKGVGTELTKEGLKELSKFDFGFEADPHNPEAMPFTRHDWFRAKLRDPRLFDRMPVVADEHGGAASGEHPDAHGAIVRYDQKVKPPGDKLKMPNFHLDDHEIELVTQFLMGLREDGIEPTMKRRLDAEEQVVEQASRLMLERNCTGCHKAGVVSAPLAILDEDTFGDDLWMAKPVDTGGKRVLEHDAWLQDEIYDPWEEEDADTLEFFEAHPPDPASGPLVVYGQGEGGIRKFIDERAMRPPLLRGEGAKVNPDWLFRFLLEPYTVRTHVEVRMPTFGFTPEQSQAITRWFAARAAQPWPFNVDTDAQVDEQLLDEGQKRFQELKCNSCHPAGGKNPSNPDKSNWGPDLALASQRLKGPWIAEWLKDPQALQPGTKMPSFFGERKDGAFKPFMDDWEIKVRALQHYLRHMDKAPPPAEPVSMSK